jgi:hypothetical protein
MSLAELAVWLQGSALSTAMQDSWAYPIIEGTHVMSLTLSVGMILWIDLRLMGVILRGEPIRGMYVSVKPWLMLGFALMAVTGALLFIMRAGAVWVSGLFWTKMILLVLCAVNIFIYHFVVEKNNLAWDASSVPPRSARISGALSLLLWLSVIVVGRFMAYTL